MSLSAALFAITSLLVGLASSPTPAGAVPRSLTGVGGIPARCCQGMAYDPVRGQIVLFGGKGADGSNLNDTWTWDGSTWTPRSPTSSPCKRKSTRMVWDGHQVMLFGGVGRAADGCPNDGVLADTWLWDGNTNTWTRCTDVPGGCDNVPQPAARYSEGMGLDGSSDATAGHVIMFGGNEALAANPDIPDELQAAANPAQDTWKWNGTSKDWVQLSPSGTLPCKRNSPALEYDPGHHQVLLFGGQGGDNCPGNPGKLNDTWQWTGTKWQKCTNCNPVPLSPRTGHRMAWDGDVGNVVLFGGSSNMDDNNWCDLQGTDLLCQDTWYIDGGAWNQQALTGTRPAKRCCFGLAWDQLHQKLVMFGGSTFGDLQCDDTWTWDGSMWTLIGGLCPA